MTALLPGTKWAWPVGDHHQLIYAVAGQDADAALAGLKDWLSSHDIDVAAFREQRLLFAAFARFGAALKGRSFQWQAHRTSASALDPGTNGHPAKSAVRSHARYSWHSSAFHQGCRHGSLALCIVAPSSLA